LTQTSGRGCSFQVAGPPRMSAWSAPRSITHQIGPGQTRGNAVQREAQGPGQPPLDWRFMRRVVVPHQMHGRVRGAWDVQRGRRIMGLPRRGLRTWASTAMALFGVRRPKRPQGDADGLRPGAEGTRRRAYDRPGGGVAPGVHGSVESQDETAKTALVWPPRLACCKRGFLTHRPGSRSAARGEQRSRKGHRTACRIARPVLR
jgi:hypothetical protein